MYLYYDPETLAPGLVVYMHDEAYDPTCNGEHFVTLPRGLGLAVEHLYLMRGDDGAVAVQVRRVASVVMPPRAIDLGQTARFAQVPIGTAVAVNGVAAGTMDDASGILEVTPARSGLYAFLFTKAGWMDAHFDLEVTPPAEPSA